MNEGLFEALSERAKDTAQRERHGVAYCQFRVGHTLLAVPALQVDEVAGQLEVTPLPRAPLHVLGLANLRGRAVPLMDLGSFLELPTQHDQHAAPRTLIVHCDDLRVGFVCSRVLGVIEILEGTTSPPSTTHGDALRRYIQAEYQGQDALGLLLDVSAILKAARARQ